MRIGTRIRYTGNQRAMRGLCGVVTKIVTVNRRKAVWWSSDKDIRENDPAPWMCPIEDVKEEIA